MPVPTLAPAADANPEPIRRVYDEAQGPETYAEFMARLAAEPLPDWPKDENGRTIFPPPTPDRDPEARQAAWDGVEARVAQLASAGDLAWLNHLLGQVAGQTAFLRQVLDELKRLRTEALAAIVAVCDEHEAWNEYEYEFTKDELIEKRLWKAFDPSDDMLGAYVDRRRK